MRCFILLACLTLAFARPQDEAASPDSSEIQPQDIPSSEEPTLIETIDFTEDESVSDEDKDKPTETNIDECSGVGDCEPYHYCFSNYWADSSVCETNNYKQDYATAVYCLGLAQGGAIEYPVHEHCQKEDAKNRGITTQESTYRCFPELGYTCADSYYMPCSPNYNDEGQIIVGQEESCPDNFTCQELEYKNGGLTKVCVADQPDATRFDSGEAVQCEKANDCGYSEIEGAWTNCYDGQCAHVQFK
ncbi:hypothetical protein TCAL_06625 [Tigriopus californicus]|uniref:Chitin-binding type-2 domain-containing protein n=1 Tax=Tigriopus californicus TaxID=6832 RepID=A0A553PK38_TIGCA|nr:uncharacterized protein LOC131890805 [Tigriopus californicus]TRY78045.1 hypothetical protein TCAL_06625 [Tigriopus californicus]